MKGLIRNEKRLSEQIHLLRLISVTLQAKQKLSGELHDTSIQSTKTASERKVLGQSL